MRILLVEDNLVLSDWLSRTLSKDGYVVECCYEGEDATHRLSDESYDLVILDLGLPRMKGEEVLQRLRSRHSNVPVLVLTAQDVMASRVACLDSGADDYVTKPFNVAELEARIRVLLRRNANHRNPTLTCADLSYNSNTRVFSLKDRDLALTPREHSVLETLMMRGGSTVSKKALAQSLFTLEESASVDAVEIYVHRLRKKLQDSQAVILTLRGLGYLLKSNAV